MSDSSTENPQTYKGHPVPVIGPTSSHEDMLRYIRILEDRLDITGHFKWLKAGDDRREGPPSEDCFVEQEHLAPSPNICPFDIPLEQERHDACRQMGMEYVAHTQAQRIEFLLGGLDKVALLQTEVALLEPCEKEDRA